VLTASLRRMINDLDRQIDRQLRLAKRLRRMLAAAAAAAATDDDD